MFKFLRDEDDDKTPSKKKDVQKSAGRQFIEVQIGSEHHLLASQIPVTESCTIPKIKYLRVQDLLKSPQVGGDPNVKTILDSSSDLVSGEYEGGFKLWECTWDLCSVLGEDTNLELFAAESGTRVLDLGCGSGLLGLYALAKGAKSVVFQDYNVEVLNFLTIPNAIANFDAEFLSSRVRFFGGSWNSMNDFLRKNKEEGQNLEFDVILSSETIYNTEYLEDFINLVDSCLSRNGSLFLAAKTCYFGVGGGTKTFISLMKSKPNFEIDVVKVIQGGVQREVLRVYRREATTL